MNQSGEIEHSSENWKAKTIFVGTIIGALVGAGAAYLLLQKADRETGKVKISAGEGVKLGVIVFGLLRQVAQLGDRE